MRLKIRIYTSWLNPPKIYNVCKFLPAIYISCTFTRLLSSVIPPHSLRFNVCEFPRLFTSIIPLHFLRFNVCKFQNLLTSVKLSQYKRSN